MRVVRDVWFVPIRLSAERWTHITSRHPEMNGQIECVVETIGRPDYVLEGDWGSLMAVRLYERTPLTRKRCVVVYRHTEAAAGFVITAYFASSTPQWRTTAWPE